METKRTIIRRFLELDLNDFYAYASVPGVGEMAGWPHHLEISGTRMILDSFIKDEDVWAIVYKENNKVIGSVGLHKKVLIKELDSPKQRELGYVLSKDYWGQGIMPEVCKEILDYGFNQLELDYITCGHFNTNNQSKRVIEKLGFEYYGESLYDAFLLKQKIDSSTYVLYRENFKKN